MDLWRTKFPNHRRHHQHHPHKQYHCRVTQVLWGTLLLTKAAPAIARVERAKEGDWIQTGILGALGSYATFDWAHLWGEEAGPQSPRLTVFCYFRNASGFRSSFVHLKRLVNLLIVT